MDNQIYNIMNDMSEWLNITQMKNLQKVLLHRLDNDDEAVEPINNLDYLNKYLSAKKVEGCTERTFKVYKSTLKNLFTAIDIPNRRLTTEIIRQYLIDYQGVFYTNRGYTPLID